MIEAIPYYSFVFARILGMFVITPIFNIGNAPNRFRVALIALLALFLLPLANLGFDLLEISTFYELIYYIGLEFINGLAFGLVISLLFNFLYIAGVMVDFNIGFAIVNVISPEDDSQIPVTANFFYIFAVMVFLALDLHHQLILALARSFQVVPLGTSLLKTALIDLYLDSMARSFVVGFQIAAPFIVTILVTNLLLGLLSKAMPGLNVFIVGLPLKIFVGFYLLLLFMPYYFDAFTNLFIEIFESLARLLNMGT
jgi:flagellar biosynthetic protein FliR